MLFRSRAAIDGKKFPDAGVKVNWHISPQTAGLGEIHEILLNASGWSAEMYMISVDDARFDTPDWDEIVRRKFAEFPDGVYLAFPHDPMSAGISTYPMFGWRWLQTIGKVFCNHFLYWFDDRWIHQVGEMAGRCAILPIVLYPIRGKGRTRRMRDLPFWTRFFQLTLGERKDWAEKLINVMHPENSPERKAAQSALETKAAEFAKEQDTFSDLYAVFQEERFTLHSPEERRAFNANSFKQESLAVGKLIGLAQEQMAKMNFAEALKFLDGTFLSSIQSRHARQMKAECLRALGKNSEADQLDRETLAAWPEMNFFRRSFRFLGKVASDGKTMLVGMAHKGDKSAKPK